MIMSYILLCYINHKLHMYIIYDCRPVNSAGDRLNQSIHPPLAGVDDGGRNTVSVHYIQC